LKVQGDKLRIFKVRWGYLKKGGSSGGGGGGSLKFPKNKKGKRWVKVRQKVGSLSSIFSKKYVKDPTFLSNFCLFFFSFSFLKKKQNKIKKVFEVNFFFFCRSFSLYFFLVKKKKKKHFPS
jgi:hypothetical protein